MPTNYVRFYKGGASNFPASPSTPDDKAFYAIRDINSLTSRLPTFDNTGSDLSNRLSELFIGNNLVGVGHLATASRPGLVPDTHGVTSTGSWYLKATASGISWTDITTQGEPLSDVLYVHSDQDILSTKTVLGRNFYITGRKDSNDNSSIAIPTLSISTRDDIGTYTDIIENNPPQVFGLTEPSNTSVDSPTIRFKGIEYSNGLYITDGTGYGQRYTGEHTSASYVIGKRNYNRISIESSGVSGMVSKGTTGSIQQLYNNTGDYLYVGSSFIGGNSFSSADIEVGSNEIIKIISPNGYDLASGYDPVKGTALPNMISIPTRSDTYSSGGGVYPVTIYPEITIGREEDYTGNITIKAEASRAVGADSPSYGPATIRADKFETRNGKDYEYIKGTGERGGVFGGTDGTQAGSIGLVPAPTINDSAKFLKGDGTWAPLNVVQDHLVKQISLSNTETGRFPLLLKHDTSTTSLDDTGANLANTVRFSPTVDAISGGSPGILSADYDGNLYTKSLSAHGGDVTVQPSEYSSSEPNANLILNNYGSGSQWGSRSTPSIIFRKGPANNFTDFRIGTEFNNSYNHILLSKKTSSDSQPTTLARYSTERSVLQIFSVSSQPCGIEVVADSESESPGKIQLTYGDIYTDSGNLYTTAGHLYTTAGSIYTNAGNLQAKARTGSDASTGFVKAPKFKVTLNNGNDITATAFTDNTFIRANGSGWGGVYGNSEDDQTHQKLPGLVPISNANDTNLEYLLQSDGSWVSPSTVINGAGALTQINAGLISPSSANTDYFPLLAVDSTSPSAQGVDLSREGIVYQGITSGDPATTTYGVAINKNGSLKANELISSSGSLSLYSGNSSASLTYNGSTTTVSSVFRASGLDSSSISIHSSGGVALDTEYMSFYWKVGSSYVPVCEWEEL
jgi:hypothetical protein